MNSMYFKISHIKEHTGISKCYYNSYIFSYVNNEI